MRAMKRLPGARFALYAAAVLAVVGLVLASGCGTGSRVAAGNVDNPTAKKLIEQGVRLIDVRTASEFEAGHIPNAENVPVDELVARAVDWDHTQPLIVYCATGSRSAEAMRALRGAGFKTVYNLTNGIVAWDGDVSAGPAGQTASGGAAPSASGLPVMYEFYTDW